QKREFESAVFWYKLATTIKEDPNKWSFTYPAYSTWYPHLQLCVCYYNLQDFENAYKHNELAREHRPGDEQILFNKELLEKRQHLVSGNKYPLAYKYEWLLLPFLFTLRRILCFIFLTLLFHIHFQI